MAGVANDHFAWRFAGFLSPTTASKEKSKTYNRACSTTEVNVLERYDRP